MNIFKFELKETRKSLITWCITSAIVFWFLIVGIYPMFADGMEVIGDLIKTMPPEFLIAFGLDVDNMIGYSGFFSFAYIYIALVGAMMTTSITVNIFGREKKCHCQEFLLTKPAKRKHLFLSKIMAVLTNLVVFNIITVGLSLFCFNHYSDLNTNAILSTLSVTFGQIIFVGISLLITMFISKIRSAATITATVGIIAFLAEVFINALKIRWLEFFSPLHFFTPKYVNEFGHYDTTLVIYGLLILILALGISFIKYIKSDLTRM